MTEHRRFGTSSTILHYPRSDAYRILRQGLNISEPKTEQNRDPMKKVILLVLVGSALTLLTGCIGLSIGGGTTTKPTSSTVGQQLVDLQKAKDAGAITDGESGSKSQNSR